MAGEYTANDFAQVCERFGITQSMGRVGSALDNAASKSFFSSLEFECRRKHHFETKAQAHRVVANWIAGFYNRVRRHSYCAGRSPLDHEHVLVARAAVEAEAAWQPSSHQPAEALSEARWRHTAGS